MKVVKELVGLEEVKAKIIGFYNPAEWHFVCINGLFENEELEIQWAFVKMGVKDEWKVFYVKASSEAILPTVADILPTARMYEGELRDLLDANFENSVKGMFIELDGLDAPLRIKR
jgi:Ni,Fe-hydrogenase III component G